MSNTIPQSDDAVVSKIGLVNNTSVDIKIDPKLTQDKSLTQKELKLIENCDILTKEYQKSIQSKLKPLAADGKIAVYSITYVVTAQNPIDFLIVRQALSGNVGLLSQIVFLSLKSFADEVRMTLLELLQMFLKIITQTK